MQTKIFFSLIVFLITAQLLFAQSQFEVEYGSGVPIPDPESNVMDTLNSGGFIIGGTWYASSVPDIALIKTDNMGNEQWRKSFDIGGNSDSVFAVKTLSDGSYLLVGNTWVGTSGDDIFVTSIDPSGTSVNWAKSIANTGTSNDMAQNATSTSDGGFILTGTSDSSGPDLWVVKLTAGLTLDWCRKVRTAFTDAGHCVKQTSDGGYIVAGTYGVSASNQDAFLMKLTSSGTITWAKRYAVDLGSSNKNEEFFSVIEMSDGKFVACGYADDFFSMQDFFVVKVKSDGSLVWAKTYDDGGTEDPGLGIARSHTAGDKDSLLIYGIRASTTYELIKTDSAGVKKFNKEFGMAGFVPYMCKEPFWMPDRSAVFTHNASASARFGLTKTKLDLTNCSWGAARSITVTARTPTVTAVAGTFLGTNATVANITVSSSTPFTSTQNTGCQQLMPVELLFFTGKNECDKTILQWETASEKNNDYFEIQRKDGSMEEWKDVGEVKGAGNSTTTLNYEFIDSELPTAAATLYYRLKQTDFDGNYKYCNPIAVKTNCGNEISIYPNPFAETATLRITNPGELRITDIKMYDVFGKEVSLSIIRNSDSFVLRRNGLPGGVYVVKISVGSRMITKKIVME
ncbi:MAG: T9SS type A sorting domain-containing protein [Bacteroidetes bacterium]|nr:T9SS type A sorting domain-containing protein [Bacteroidota bacterium]